MPSIKDLFKRIFGRKTKMLNSGENFEIVEEIGAEEENKIEIKEKQFIKELKEKAQVSKIDPSRYEKMADLYMAIFEDMGVDKDVLSNPQAKIDLTFLVEEIVEKQPEEQSKRLLNPRSEQEAKVLQDLIKGTTKVGKDGSMAYFTNFENVGKNVSRKEIKIFSSELGNYKCEDFVGVINAKGIIGEHIIGGEMRQSKHAYMYDKEGIQIESESVYSTPTEVKDGYKRNGAIGVYGFGREFQNIQERIKATRLSYFNRSKDNKNLADWATMRVEAQETGKDDVVANVSLYKNLESLYLPDILVYDKAFLGDLDQYHWSDDGKAKTNEEVEKIMMKGLEGRFVDKYEKDDTIKCLRKFLGKEESSLEMDD